MSVVRLVKGDNIWAGNEPAAPGKKGRLEPLYLGFRIAGILVSAAR
jgi:hypothetical protein